jgi:uncharacterized protein
MKSFLVTLKEKSQRPLSEALCHAHVEHLKQLKQQGHLIVCGPFTDNAGAVLILQAISKQAVENLIEKDPFIQENYYQQYKITEFQMANEENHYLIDE